MREYYPKQLIAPFKLNISKFIKTKIIIVHELNDEKNIGTRFVKTTDKILTQLENLGYKILIKKHLEEKI